jgi:hypothetical protein
VTDDHDHRSRWEEILRELLRECTLIRGELGNIGARVATVAENVRHNEGRIGELATGQDALRRDVTALQRWKWTIASVAGAAALVLTPALQVIAK